MTQYYDVLDYQEQEIRKAFKRFDTDGTGFLDHTQLKRALKNIGDQLTEEECDEFFNLTDTNNDGKIDIEGTLVYTVTPLSQFLRHMFNFTLGHTGVV